VSIKEINEGDFAMILGYPGRTSRYFTSYEVNEQLQIVHPVRIKVRGIKQEVWMNDMKADAYEFGGKSSSQRLRGVLFRLWQQDSEGFDSSVKHY
jgi:hypothetical protein